MGDLNFSIASGGGLWQTDVTGVSHDTDHLTQGGTGIMGVHTGDSAVPRIGGHISDLSEYKTVRLKTLN